MIADTFTHGNGREGAKVPAAARLAETTALRDACTRTVNFFFLLGDDKKNERLLNWDWARHASGGTLYASAACALNATGENLKPTDQVVNYLTHTFQRGADPMSSSSAYRLASTKKKGTHSKCRACAMS